MRCNFKRQADDSLFIADDKWNKVLKKLIGLKWIRKLVFLCLAICLVGIWRSLGELVVNFVVRFAILDYFGYICNIWRLCLQQEILSNSIKFHQFYLIPFQTLNHLEFTSIYKIILSHIKISKTNLNSIFYGIKQFSPRSKRNLIFIIISLKNKISIKNHKKEYSLSSSGLW